MTISSATRTEILRQKELYPSARSAVLPSLWALQHEAGYLPVEGMREVADLLGLAPSEVQAVSTFYSMYFDKPPGSHTVLLCKNVSCALRGSDEIEAHLQKSLGCASGETTADGAFTWESTVECLGACGGAPAMQVDHHFHENLTPDGVDAIFARYRSTAPTHHTTDAAATDVVVDATPESKSKSKTSRSKRPRPNADDL